MAIEHVCTSMLDIAFEQGGASGGPSVVLLHGFPYDVRAYDQAGAALVAAGFHVVAPYLRGYGQTKFLDPDRVRSGEQAALANDLVELMAALSLKRPILVGYDWGGRAACATAAIRPDLVAGLVTGGGYNIFGPAMGHLQADPALAHRLWYMYCFHSSAGAALFRRDPKSFCRYLWNLWSPSWQFDDETFSRSAGSFENPDFADVVIHSYRHRAGLVAGDPELADLEALLLSRPPINVPAITLQGADDAIQPPPVLPDDSRFHAFYERRTIVGAGHNVPQEKPSAVVAAVRDVALQA